MRLILLSLCFGLILVPVGAQTPKKTSGTTTPVKKSATTVRPNLTQPDAEKTPDEKAELDKAAAVEDPAERIAALRKFIAAFPDSALLSQAKELLSSTAYSAADGRFTSGDVPAAINFYKLAAVSAPTPVPAALFNDSLSKIPNTLYWSGNRTEAVEIAKTLETKIGSDADQLSALAMFFVGIENGDEAVRLADAAVKADPTRSRSYGVLGLASRVDFKLDESAAAYAKAVELDPDSASLKRNLAEIKRATGKPDEAVELYRQVVSTDANDLLSQNGLVLSLFDAGKTDEAEKTLAASLEQNPNNVMLMAGASYWYAAHKMDEKALELARRAINANPRYVWSHIALGRALMLQNRPVEAEEALLKARAYGNFATLEYEIASARAMAGFYRDAVEGLEKTFAVEGDSVVTKIGGRVVRKGTTFTDVLADERRASILEPAAADDADTAARLKELLILHSAVKAQKPDAAAVARAAAAFAAGDDNSKYHRQLYASSLLLNNNIAVDKALELAEAAVGNSDNALVVPNAGAFVMASELYESRQLALSRNEFVHVPDVPRTTLAAILRGRIEDLIGWALVQENKPADAEIHFKRAVAILPEKSAWWRASMWRYGTALQADGKEVEALEAYIKSYSIDKPDLTRYTIVETLYKKLNGGTEGLDARIGPSPLPSIEAVAKNDAQPGQPTVTATPNIDAPQSMPAALPVATVSPDATKADAKRIDVPTTSVTDAYANRTNPSETPPASESGVPPIGKRERTVESKPITKEKPQPDASPVPTPSPETAPSPTPDPEAKSTESPSPTPGVESSPAPSPAVVPSPTESPRTAEPSSSPSIEKNLTEKESTPAGSPTPIPEAVPTPTPQPIPESKSVPEKSATPEPTITPDNEKKATTVEPSPTVIPTPTPLERPTATPNQSSEYVPPPKVAESPTPQPTPSTNDTLRVEKAEPSRTIEAKPSETPVSEPVALPERSTAAVPEPSPTPGAGVAKRVKTELVVSSTIPLPTPSPVPDEKSIAEVTKKTVPDRPAQSLVSQSLRSLFDPVVITIPKNETTKPSDKPTLEIDRGNVDGRARLVDGQPVNVIEPPPCQVTVSQEKLSLLNNGGTLALLVGVENGEPLSELKYLVSDPDDISVKFEPDIGGVEGRSLYVITSISERTGNFRVTFYMPCGRKDVTITVR